MTELDPIAYLNGPVFIPGRLLFSKIWGSHSHQTNMPESDIDYLGVYVATNERLLGMDPPPETITGEKPDYQIHEVGKFCQLLIKGNPGIVEMLFTDRMVKKDSYWDALVAERHLFLSKRVVTQYLGYCQGQLHKMAAGGSLHSKGGEYSTKWAYHMVRLAIDAKRIAQGKEPLVWKEGEERELLMKIRRGEMTKDTVEKLGISLINEVDALKPWLIQDEAPRNVLNGWLLMVRELR